MFSKMNISDLFFYMQGKQETTNKEYFFKVISFDRFNATIEVYEKDSTGKLVRIRRETVEH